MTTLAEHLARLDSQKVLLVEIDPAGVTPIYLADAPYYTEPGDAPANQNYWPVIAQDGVPRLARRIQEVWGGRSVPAWGPLVVATPIVGTTDLVTAALRGKDVRVYLTGPRSIIPRASAASVLTGLIGSRSGDIDGAVVLEITDRQAAWEAVELPSARYNGTETANFPAAEVGRSIPRCLGRCRNITPRLINTATRVYQVNDGAVQAIDVVYDNGVSVAFTANNAAGTFTLTNPPVGVITADVRGTLDGATWLSSTTQIIDWLARTDGGLGAGNIDIAGLPNDEIGIYLDEPTSLADVITKLMQGVLGWLGFTRTGNLRARLFDVPVAGGPAFGEQLHLSPVTWEEDPDIVWSVPLLYMRNWSRIEQVAASVSLNQAAWLRGDGYEAREENAAIQTTYPDAIASDRIETYFDTLAPAQTVAQRALTLFGTLRRRARTSLPFIDPPIELGDSLALEDADMLSGNRVLMAIEERWDGEIPLIEVELWG